MLSMRSLSLLVQKLLPILLYSHRQKDMPNLDSTEFDSWGIKIRLNLSFLRCILSAWLFKFSFLKFCSGIKLQNFYYNCHFQCE